MLRGPVAVAATVPGAKNYHIAMSPVVRQGLHEAPRNKGVRQPLAVHLI